MTGLSEMPIVRNLPQGKLYTHTMADGTKVMLRDFDRSNVGEWTLDFAKVPEMKVNKLEIKFVYEK